MLVPLCKCLGVGEVRPDDALQFLEVFSGNLTNKMNFYFCLGLLPHNILARVVYGNEVNTSYMMVPELMNLSLDASMPLDCPI